MHLNVTQTAQVCEDVSTILASLTKQQRTEHGERIARLEFIFSAPERRKAQSKEERSEQKKLSRVDAMAREIFTVTNQDPDADLSVDIVGWENLGMLLNLKESSIRTRISMGEGSFKLNRPGFPEGLKIHRSGRFASEPIVYTEDPLKKIESNLLGVVIRNRINPVQRKVKK